jgi:hypothetical protein
MAIVPFEPIEIAGSLLPSERRSGVFENVRLPELVEP